MASSNSPQGNNALEIRDVKGLTVVRIVDESFLEESHIDDTRNAITKVFESDGVKTRKKVVMNLSAITYMSSIGLGMFVTLNGRVRKAGVEMILCELRPTIQELMDVTRLDKILTIVATENDAVATP